MANQQFDERSLFLYNNNFDTSSGTDPVVLVSGGGAGTRIDSLFATNYDSVDHTLLVGLYVGTTISPFAVVALPAAVAGVPSIKEIIQTVFSASQACILGPGAQLYGRLVEVVTDDATPVTLTYFGGNL